VRPGRDADRSPASSAEVLKERCARIGTERVNFLSVDTFLNVVDATDATLKTIFVLLLCGLR
jgi:hypothetical protein